MIMELFLHCSQNVGALRSLKFGGKMALFTRVEELHRDTRDIADILLDAEVKLGEMLEKIKRHPRICFLSSLA